MADEIIDDATGQPIVDASPDATTLTTELADANAKIDSLTAERDNAVKQASDSQTLSDAAIASRDHLQSQLVEANTEREILRDQVLSEQSASAKRKLTADETAVVKRLALDATGAIDGYLSENELQTLRALSARL